MPTPTTVTITANGTQKAAFGTAFLPVTGRLTDENGAGVASATLTMTGVSGRGAFTGGGLTRNVTTNATGHATFPAWIANSTADVYDPRVSYPALAQAHANFENVNPAIATGMTINSGSGQSAPPSNLFANPLVARVANEVNGPVAGVTVVFNAPDSGASLVWTLPATDPVAAVSDVNGLATSPTFSANAIAGTYNVQASSSGLPSKNFQLTNGGVAPAVATSSLQMCEV